MNKEAENPTAHILVVDDNPTNLELLGRLLRARKFVVTECAGGAQCLELLQQQRFDLVLMDVVMPELGGLEVCRRIKANPALVDVFVALISSQETSPEKKAEGLDGGADEYIVRPVSSRELVARINALLRLQQSRRELRCAHEALEARVAERTAQLTQANLELRGKEQQLIAAHQLALLGSWHWDVPSGRVTWSPETYQILGADPSRGEPGYGSFFELVLPEDRESVQRAVEHSLATGEPYAADYRIRRPDGTVRFIHGQAEVERDLAGRVVRMVGINQDITARKQAEEELRALPRRIIEAQEQERRRVARELHDGVNQILSSVRFRVQAIEGRLQDADNELHRDAHRAAALLERALNEVRRISENLRPSELDELGLAAAVRGVCDEFKERTRLTVEVRCQRVPRALPADLSLTLYRSAQEALTNIEKHAAARKVSVRLAREDGWLVLIVTDDGDGFDSLHHLKRRSKRGGFGLANLRERAAIAGGSFDLRTAPGQGTVLTVRLPVPDPHES